MNGLVNYAISGDKNAIWKSALIGAGSGFAIGGLMGGLKAKAEGKNFWKGWNYQYETLAMSGASDLPPVGQRGDANCGAATAEWVDKTFDGNMSQEQIRNLVEPGTNPQTRGLLDTDVWNAYGRASGHTATPSNNIELSEVMSNMQNGNRVALTTTTSDGTPHQVAMRSIVRETITRANGRVTVNILYNIMDPLSGGSYYSVPGSYITRSIHVFYIRP
jgi:hypothetical protein